jgi:addiction module HigA family antidote
LIRSFKDKLGPLLFEGYRPRDFPADLVKVTRRKLQAIAAAKDIRDLLHPPGNRLEKLKGDRSGQWSIRINDQWRICLPGSLMERMMSKSSTIIDGADPKFRRLPPLHPGEVLREEFLVPLGMSAHALAQALGVPRARIERLAREQAAVTADTAVRLSRYFGTTAEFWMNLQTSFDIRTATQDLKKQLKKIAPHPHLGHRAPRSEAAE